MTIVYDSFTTQTQLVSFNFSKRGVAMSTFKTKEDMFASSDDEEESVVKGNDDEQNTKKRKPEGRCF